MARRYALTACLFVAAAPLMSMAKARPHDHIPADPNLAIAMAWEQLAQDPNDGPSTYLLGLGYFKKGDNPNALKAFERVTQLQPTDDDSHYAVGLVLRQMHREGQAVAAFEAALRINPTNPDIMFDLALSHLALDHGAVATGLLERVVRAKPRWAAAFYNLGIGREQTGDLVAAVAAYQKADSLDPNQPAAAINLATVYAAQGATSEAEATLRRVTVQAPEEAIAWYDLGVILARQDHLDEAIAAYRQAVAKDAKQAAAFNNLGIIYTHRQDAAQAQLAFAAAVVADPNFADARYNFGLQALREGHDVKAMAAFEATLQLQPQHRDALILAGQLSADRGELTKSVQYYGAAARNMPEDIHALRVLGDVYLRDGQFARARAAFSTIAAVMHPPSAEVLEARARAERGDGALPQAIATLRRALATEGAGVSTAAALVDALLAANRGADAVAQAELVVKTWGQDPNAWLILASLHRKGGHPDVAQAAAQKALDIDPGSPPAHLELARIALWRRDLKAARRYIAEATRVNSGDACAWTVSGEVAYEAGAPQEAVVFLQRALALDADEPQAHYHMGFARYRLGQREAAANAFREAVRCAPHFAEAYYQLGRVLEKQGDIAGAVQALQRALAERADYTDAALALAALGRTAVHGRPAPQQP